MRGLILFAATVVGITGLISLADSAEHTKDSLDKVKMSMKDGKAVLIDVREQSEWDNGHLKSALLLPLSVLTTGVKADDVAKVAGKGQVIYLHCGSGIRCLKAADELKKLGYDVRPLKQGYKDLLKAGFPAAK